MFTEALLMPLLHNLLKNRHFIVIDPSRGRNPGVAALPYAMSALSSRTRRRSPMTGMTDPGHADVTRRLLA